MGRKLFVPGRNFNRNAAASQLVNAWLEARPGSYLLYGFWRSCWHDIVGKVTAYCLRLELGTAQVVAISDQYDTLKVFPRFFSNSTIRGTFCKSKYWNRYNILTKYKAGDTPSWDLTYLSFGEKYRNDEVLYVVFKFLKKIFMCIIQGEKHLRRSLISACKQNNRY